MTLSAWELESPNYAPVHSGLLNKIKAGNLVLEKFQQRKVELIPQVIKVVS